MNCESCKEEVNILEPIKIYRKTPWGKDEPKSLWVCLQCKILLENDLGIGEENNPEDEVPKEKWTRIYVYLVSLSGKKIGSCIKVRNYVHWHLIDTAIQETLDAIDQKLIEDGLQKEEWKFNVKMEREK